MSRTMLGALAAMPLGTAASPTPVLAGSYLRAAGYPAWPTPACAPAGAHTPPPVPPPAATAPVEELQEACWLEILPRTKLQAHTRHFFEKELSATGECTHVRLNINPDGGESRLRVWGVAEGSGADE